MGGYLRQQDTEGLRKLIETARRERAAEKWIRHATFLNVYTGELQTGHIAIAGERIAYVGEKEPLADDGTEIVDATGFVLVPGYIEPHAHPFQLYTPLTLAAYALGRGTTTLVNDNLFFYVNMPQDELEAFLEETQEWPAKMLWWARLDAQSRSRGLENVFTLERMQRMLAHPLVVQAGELTEWPALLQGDPALLQGMLAAKRQGKRVEGHLPGASVETLNAVAAAGVTACHEAINAEEVLRRLRLGMYVALRHSSIRPDMPELIEGLLEQGIEWTNRLLLTTDGSPPAYLENGFTDYVLRLALEAGLDPVPAYRMATLNPATYYGLDADIGGIAPGRIADILFLEDLRAPTPRKVMANGKWAAENGIVNDDRLRTFAAGEDRLAMQGYESVSWRATPDAFAIPWRDGEKFPVIELSNAVITLERRMKLPVREGKITLPEGQGLLYVSFIGRDGRFVTNGVLKGFADRFGDRAALASTYTASPGVLVVGSDRQAMAQAVNRVLEMGGGITWLEGDDTEWSWNVSPGNEGKSRGFETLFELPLPLAGMMSRAPMSRLIAETKRFYLLLQERGYRHSDPVYTLLFLTATHLPKLRLTGDGLYEVRNREVVIPSANMQDESFVKGQNFTNGSAE
ncbi:adenine deaminase C-terminal domain-containing protein [Bacillaceae bacterium]